MRGNRQMVSEGGATPDGSQQHFSKQGLPISLYPTHPIELREKGAQETTSEDKGEHTNSLQAYCNKMQVSWSRRERMRPSSYSEGRQKKFTRTKVNPAKGPDRPHMIMTFCFLHALPPALGSGNHAPSDAHVFARVQAHNVSGNTHYPNPGKTVLYDAARAYQYPRNGSYADHATTFFVESRNPRTIAELTGLFVHNTFRRILAFSATPAAARTLKISHIALLTKSPGRVTAAKGLLRA